MIFRRLDDCSKRSVQLYHRHFFLGAQIPRSRIPSLPREVHEAKSGKKWQSQIMSPFTIDLDFRQTCLKVDFFNTYKIFISPSPLGIGSSAADLSRPSIVRKQFWGHWVRAEANGGFNAKVPVAEGRPSRSNPSSEHDVSQCCNVDMDDSGYFLLYWSQSCLALLIIVVLL